MSRHLKSGRHFRRDSAHQKAMFANLVTALLRHERVQTTDAKAKELRRFAEQTISHGVRLGDLLIQNREQMKPDDRARVIHAMRLARRTVRQRDVLQKLFDEIAPRYLGRQGGYTRITKVKQRKGDAAPISLIELVEGEAPASAAPTRKERKEGGRDVPKARAHREALAQETKGKEKK